jgi:hypothetical protein
LLLGAKKVHRLLEGDSLKGFGHASLFDRGPRYCDEFFDVDDLA